MGFLDGKKALVLGIANERSIAWGISKALKAQGGQLGISYLNEKMKERVVPLADEVQADFTFELDVTREQQVNALPDLIAKNWGKFDILIHSLAFADKADLKGGFLQTSREGFLTAMNISAYSLIELCRVCGPLMSEDASVLAMTYHGSQQVVPGYDVMAVAKAALETSIRYLAYEMGPQGVRVNGISAGPIRTLAASGVPGMRKMFDTVEERAPLRRNVTPDDVGGTAAYLAGPLGSGVSGQIIYVDSGIATVACV